MPTKEAAKPGEDATDMPGISLQHLQFSSTLRKVSRSGCRSQVDMLNLSPRPSHRYRCPETELLKEIAALELEVFHLERYLLSLYRDAFDHHLTAARDKEQACESPSTCQVESPLKDSSVQEKCESKLVSSYRPSTCISSCNNRRVDNSCSLVDIKNKDEFKFQNSGKHPRNDLADSKVGNAPPTGKRSGDSSRPTPCHRSLADHLDSSLVECVCNTPSKLSEEIIRCISSIYNKLADQPVPQTELSASPISSISSSSTFSSQDTYDAWSPKYYYESTMSPHHSKRPRDIQGPYSRMLEVRKLCINGSRFDYAAKMLQNFRALICQLEAVDPIKMEHEEKLAFWINIHNALVMHAYLAYGLRQNQMKSTSSIMKAAYNVGGLSVNAQEIQSSIFGCQPHRPELRLQKLFSQSQKFMNGRLKHPYAVNQLEPLVHFALCMGAYSDPAVRIYTAKNVLEELELAKDEFVRSKVSIRKETRIILPKILQYHARDAAIDLSATLKMAHDCMPETQQKAIHMCLKGRPERCVEWSSYKSDFRYIINEELAKE